MIISSRTIKHDI